MTEAPRLARGTVAALLLAVATLVGPWLHSAPATAAPSGDNPTRFADVMIDSVTPSIVTTGSRPTVTVSGEVHNSSDRSLHSLSIRLQRGQRVTSAGQLRSTLAADAATFERSGPFVSIGGVLEPGQRKSFRLSLSLSGSAGLGIDETGVYPLLVNLNAVPDYGAMARVGDSRTLLPVLSLPPDSARADNYVPPNESGERTDPTNLGPDGSVSADVGAPSALTMLWPLAAPPQVAAGRLGDGGPVTLISEQLAQSLAPGGRLRTVVDALAPVVGDDAPDPATDDSTPAPTTTPAATAPSKLSQSLCLAVDPDLVQTVQAMSHGYQVVHERGNPAAATSPGTGAANAQAWLHDLRRIASRLCVVALPFGRADLDALNEVGDAGLSAAALSAPADEVDRVLGVKSVRGLVVPSMGAVTSAGAGVLERTAMTRALTTSSSVAAPPNDAGAYRAGAVGVQTYDAPITAALGAVGAAPITPVLTPDDQQVQLSDESPASRRQAAVAALVYPAIHTPSGPSRPAALPVTGRSQVLLPPDYWSPSAADASALLSSATLLLESGVARPMPLTKTVDTLGGDLAPGRLVAPPDTMLASNRGWLPSARSAATIADASALSWKFQASLVNSSDVDTTPDGYLAPLRADLLRGLAAPAQDTPTARAGLRAERVIRVNAVQTTLDKMQSSVTLLDPGGRYTLVSERSPLLLVARNDLDLPIRVHINTIAPDELSVGDVGIIEIPAKGTRQIQLPTRAQTSEAMRVQISLVTSTGVTVGTPVGLSVNSNAYGKSLFIVTIVAAVALVLLVARRLWHRFRGEPDPADAHRPEADEMERALAATDYEHRLESEAQRDAQREEELSHPGAAQPPADIDAEDRL